MNPKTEDEDITVLKFKNDDSAVRNQKICDISVRDKQEKLVNVSLERIIYKFRISYVFIQISLAIYKNKFLNYYQIIYLRNEKSFNNIITS